MQFLLLRSPRLPVALLCLLAIASPGLRAQTPWESAPAKPAPLPRINSAQVTNLPPPPSRSTGIQSPPHVSLSIGIGEDEEVRSNPKPEVNVSPTFTVSSPKRQPLQFDLPLPPIPNATTGSTSSLPKSVGASLPNMPPANPANAPQSNLPISPQSVLPQSRQPDLTKLAFPPALGTQDASNRYPGTQANTVAGSPNAASNSTAGLAKPAPSFAQPGPRLSPAPETTSSFPNRPNGTALPSPTAVSSPVSNEPPSTKKLESGTLIAVVGSEHILAGDLSSYVEPIIEKNRDRIRGESQERQIREQIIRQVLVHYVQTKAMFQEFFHDAAGTTTPDKIEEMKANVLPKAGKIFYEKQVPVMQEKHGVKDMAGLEAKLREKSMSLETMRSTFIEQVLASELERKYVPNEFEVTRDELVDYYGKNKDKWNEAAKARWQQLTVRFDKHDRDIEAVRKRIHQLGNEIYLGGKRFEEVAKQSSEGYTASEGGSYDWTTQGSLKSKPLDAALFSLPLNELSQVIEDDIGMHIIRVLERTQSRVKPFTEAQSEIRKSISDRKRQDEIKKFRKRIMDRTPIWSLWPKDLAEIAEHARPLSDAVEQ